MRRRVLAVELCDMPDALPRVLTVLRRRQCRVMSLEYSARDRDHGGRLVVGVAAPSSHAHCLEAWLENLVDVRSVEALSG
jgi:acetolactate synthase regulatory subunit